MKSPRSSPPRRPSRWTRSFPGTTRRRPSYVNRVRCLAQWMPELELPAFDAAGLQAILPRVCHGCRSLDELRKAPWLAHLQAALTPQQQQALAREAPERIEVPSGSRIKLHYEPGKPPVLAVRIQEIFGMLETPRVAGRRVPVLLHLLAPNHRPQQVTDDLASFWRTTYHQVRKDLRRRYPKHAWPEDPYQATAEEGRGGRDLRRTEFIPLPSVSLQSKRNDKCPHVGLARPSFRQGKADIMLLDRTHHDCPLLAGMAFISEVHDGRDYRRQMGRSGCAPRSSRAGR